MRESVIYQEILQEGEQKGRQEGERLIVLRLLNRQIGPLETATLTQINALSSEQLESLSEALLDFKTPADLQHWLQQS